LFLYTVTDFSAAEKARGVKFCMRVGLLSGQVFVLFGEHWFAGSHGGGGISSGMTGSGGSWSCIIRNWARGSAVIRNWGRRRCL